MAALSVVFRAKCRWFIYRVKHYGDSSFQDADSPCNWKKTDPTTGDFVKLNPDTAGPLAKLEPMVSYVRRKWGRGWRPAMKLS